MNVVDLMTLQPKDQHPHGISDRDFDAMFTHDRPVIFAYHGYPYLIHRLTYSRKNHSDMHVHGYKEEGTTTTPFDMTVLNRLDRYHLAIDVIDRVPGLAVGAAHVKQRFRDKLLEQRVMCGSMARICPKSGIGSGLARQVPKQATNPPPHLICQVQVASIPKPILVLNAGSSSIEFGLFDAIDNRARHLFAGEVADFGDKPHITITDMRWQIILDRSWPHPRTQEDILQDILALSTNAQGKTDWPRSDTALCMADRILWRRYGWIRKTSTNCRA